ncbi:GmrSD restriction endonuclease domain-containing protein [Hornefia butyriciproducens]|uniref:GmrSD restriction endonuclease domain-containing protein n=1 Tax=Hornefia butyriciproducens TaxID=2652293 RepID=UPI003F8BADE0
MQQIFSNTNLTVTQLIEKIDSGELGLPELQRPFIWKDTKVRDLFDSMLHGYPIGYLMLWECPTLEKKKTIGAEKHSFDAPKEVIIDGQQRLTSLYAVMKGKKVVNSNYAEKSIIISFNPLQRKFEVGYKAVKNNPEWIYNISELYTSKNSFKFISDFIMNLSTSRESEGMEFTDEEQAAVAESINAVINLKEHTLPVFDIKANAEEEDVSEIFVRVNSGGVALKQNDFILTLLSLYWDEGRKEIERFSKESRYPAKDKVTSYNQLTEVSAQDIVRVVMAYAFDRARLKYGYKLLRGADFDKRGTVDIELRDKRFDVLKSKLPDVLNVHNWHEFLKAIMNAGYLSGDMILSGNAVSYTYAFYLIAKYRFNASCNENMHLTSLWFFYASLTSLYTGSFESTVENHLNTIKEMKTLDDYKRFVLSRAEERLTNDYFDVTLTGSEGLAVSGRGNNAWNAYVASLNVLNAKILFSKSNLIASKLFEPGTDGKRKSLEKHHLFPKAYLKRLGYPDSKINQMANYAYIDWKDNVEILDDAPSNYYPAICAGRSREDILSMEQENALPHGWENMDYEEFLIERRKLMAAKIKETFTILKNNVKDQC